MAEGKLTMFGKSFKTVGDNEANLCLYTKGDVKVKTPQRFITIFKNGRLNVDDFTEIFKIGSEDEMKKVGVYLVTNTDEDGNEDQSVYLYIDGEKILLASSGDNFLSYSATQELTPDQVTLALSNVGLYFQTIEDAKNSGIQNGVVYILNENEPYKVVNGEFVKLITPTDDSSDGTSDHEHTYTELQIGGIYIDGGSNRIDSESELTLQVNGHNYIVLKGDKIYIKKDVELSYGITVSSQGAVQGESGFWIYTQDGETYLEVDNLIVHNSSSEEDIPKLFQAHIGTSVFNLITKAEWVAAPNDIQLSLRYRNDFAINDYVIIQTLGMGNKLTVDYKNSTSSSGNNVYLIEGNLESAPNQDVLVRVTYGTEDYDTGETSTAVIEFEIPAQVYDDEEGVWEPNTYGSIEVPGEPEINEIINVVVVQGDSDIYWDNDSTEESIPGPYLGVVTSKDPLIVNIPALDSSGSDVLDNLKYSIINKMCTPDISDYALYQSNYQLSLIECLEYEPNIIRANTLVKIGNLNRVETTRLSYPEYFDFERYGLYTDQMVSVCPILYGAEFGYRGDVGRHDVPRYPYYADQLDIPAEIDDEQYDKFIPDIEWVKALIDKNITDVKVTTNHVFIACHIDREEENEMCLISIPDWYKGNYSWYHAYGVAVVDGNGMFVIALDESEPIPFSSGYELAGERRNSIGLGVSDTNGEENTVAIINASSPDFITNTTDYAAGYCANYGTDTFPAGYWYLPSLGELLTIKAYIGEINFALDLVGGTLIKKELHVQGAAYWASGEYSEDTAWQLNMSEGHLVTGNKVEQAYYVRPITRMNKIL